MGRASRDARRRRRSCPGVHAGHEPFDTLPRRADAQRQRGHPRRSLSPLFRHRMAPRRTAARVRPTLSAAEIASDPRLLLHQVDPMKRQLIFRRTTADAVRSAAFIDGRTDIWTGEPALLGFDDALKREPREQEQRRYIFHMSFCGSTLLARLLDRPGKVLSLKEPNCLVDLAYWRTALVAADAPSADFGAALQFAAAMLARPWDPSEQVVVKPSSWANNLLDKLSLAASRAVFVTIARNRFVEAVVRGGNERLAFTARLAAHLAPFVSGGPALLQAAMDSTSDPLGKVARLALVAHDLEVRLFEGQMGEG